MEKRDKRSFINQTTKVLRHLINCDSVLTRNHFREQTDPIYIDI